MDDRTDRSVRAGAEPDHAAREQALFAVLRALVRELHPGHRRDVDISRASRIDRDLGIDSLARTELLLRIEHAFHLRLPVGALNEADTVADILSLLDRAGPESIPPAAAAPIAAALPRVPAAAEARTLTEVLDWHVARHGERVHVTVLQDDVTVLGTVTYHELARAAHEVAAGLIARDIAPGDRIALMLPTGLDFFAAFFGILYAGAIPVPIYPPSRLAQLEEHMRRQAGILRNAGARILVTVPQGLGIGALLRGQVPSLNEIVSVATLAADLTEVRLPPATDSAATGLIQYTSGSTGDPKGVVLSHANLIANIRAFGRALDASSADVVVSWLPLYHDMGLIGAWLGSLYFAAPFYVMSPLSFLARPESWLRTLHRYGGTISAAPNFAFELCLNKIDDVDLAGLDLGALRVLASGAEPVSIHTLRRFIERFRHYGLRPGAMAPVYGLAECAVALAIPPPGRGPLIDRVDRGALTRRGVAEPARPDDPNALEIVACGQPVPEHDIRIVDELGHELGERHEGRLEFRGPSATAGYFQNEVKTRELLRDGWLDSGDRAYMAGGDVFITGRIKDIIIRGGRNIYPHEVEEAVGEIDGFRRTGVAVFGITDPASGTERLVVLAETEETDGAAREGLRARAHEVATAILGDPPDEIALVAVGTVPKTASGKIRRTAARDLFLTGRLDVKRRALWWQITRLTIGGTGPTLSRLGRIAGQNLYAAWWWTAVATSFFVGWIAVMTLPQLSWRWGAVRAVARAALAALGAPVRISGIENIPAGNAVLLFNHASYIDALVLAAVLPGEPIYVAKKELASQVFAGPLLGRLGVLFVERYDVAGSVADTEAVTAAARRGRNLVFFPEGTFTRRAGLLGFHLGAFKIAGEADLPVVPGALRGTRSMLRGDQWFPRWSPVAVDVAEPIKPLGADFASLLRLRDAARAAILARCGEPDLGGLEKPAPPAS